MATTKNPKRGGPSAATTFRRDELEAAVDVIGRLQYGGDATIVARSKPWQSFASKVRRMLQRLDEPPTTAPGGEA